MLGMNIFPCARMRTDHTLRVLLCDIPLGIHIMTWSAVRLRAALPPVVDTCLLFSRAAGNSTGSGLATF